MSECSAIAILDRWRMSIVNTFIARSIKPCLFIFGLATCAILPIAVDIRFIAPMLVGVVDYTPSSVPALRHWRRATARS